MPQDIGAGIAPGMTIDRYRIERLIGAGSMGDVFCGVDIDLKRKVALKILSERHRDNRELRARFVREARAVAAISHPNVVQVFTTGTYDDRPYLAMEFLDGTDLGTSVKEQGAWTSLQAARAVLDAARGLDAAAKAGLIHRDVKPANLVLLRGGDVKVTDFGLAKPVETGDEPALTAMGVVVGTPDYIAPEQARGDAIDERVDIYALGGTLHYLLTGMPPFRTGRPADDKYLKVVARHLKKAPPDPRTRNPEADRELSRLVKIMMAKRPVDRPDYAELIDQLSAIVERFERGGAVAAPHTLQAAGPGGRVSPTPVVGGREPAPLAAQPAATSSAATTTMISDRVHGAEAVDDAAPTRVRLSAAASRRGAAPGSDRVATGPARWLVITTLVSAAIFFTGLGLLLFGPMPEAPAATRRDGGQAGASSPSARSPSSPAQGAADAAVTPALEAPEGMIVIERADGTPLFVDARPVTHAEYAEIFPSHEVRERRANRPVTGVSYAYAQAYASARQKRLLTAAEWEAAARAEGFTAGVKLWEWVSDESADEDGKQPVRSLRGAALRSAHGGRDVTFRLARTP